VRRITYKSLWEIPLLPPFEEFEHTADIAFLLRGNTPEELHRHAELALSFKFPPLIEFFSAEKQHTVQEIVIALNVLIGKADQIYGCPLKAVSFHGNIAQGPHNLLYWEMIVDV